MSAMPEKWTDREIDGLSHKLHGIRSHMTKCFENVDKRFEQVDKRFAQVDKRFEQVDADLREQRREMNAGFASIQRAMFGTAVAIVVALIGAPHL
jgi:uncharacterized coiled-coil DUF342 family protein